MFGLGFGELVVILFLGLLLFGNHLPRMARSLGNTVLEVRKEVRSLEEDARPPVS
jgi:TatA/E family protein of Tat protein translocase